jgi:hypothetical protein
MFNLGGFDKMLQLANSDDLQLPAGVNDALRATGSSYRVPTERFAGGQGHTQLPEGTGKALELLGSEPPVPKALKKLDSSPVAGLAKKVAGAVAAFYTGGASAAAMNLGGQVLSQSNPRAGALFGGATKLFGGGG